MDGLEYPPARQQPGCERDRGQAAAEVRIASAAAHRLRIERLIAVLRRIGGKAIGAGHIDILDRDPSASREHGLEPAEDLLGLAHMRQKKARMNEGERAAFEVMRVGGYKFDRPYACFPRVLARKLEHMRIEIDAENMTLGPDDLSHVERDMTAATANVEHRSPCLSPASSRSSRVVSRMMSESRSSLRFPSSPPAIA